MICSDYVSAFSALQNKYFYTSPNWIVVFISYFVDGWLPGALWSFLDSVANARQPEISEGLYKVEGCTTQTWPHEKSGCWRFLGRPLPTSKHCCDNWPSGPPNWEKRRARVSSQVKQHSQQTNTACGSQVGKVLCRSLTTLLWSHWKIRNIVFRLKGLLDSVKSFDIR